MNRNTHSFLTSNDQNKDTLFSFYKKPIRNVIPCRDVSLNTIYKDIGSDKYKAVTERLRSRNNDNGNDIKTNDLDYVTFSGTFKKRSAKAFIKHSGLICLDLDDLQDIEGTKKKIISELSPALMFVSPSGNGLKVVYKIAIDQAKHTDYFKTFKAFFSSVIGIDIDDACKDVSRACFLCYDPDVFLNEDSRILDHSFIYQYRKDDILSAANKKEEVNQYKNTDAGSLTPWEDFNKRNKVWDLISDKFTTVRNTVDKRIIRRLDATSPHSGYIYNDNDILYLFSSEVKDLEPEKAYTAWDLNVLFNFKGDHIAAAKQAYREGYGTRFEKEVSSSVNSNEVKSSFSDKIKEDTPQFPIKGFPDPLQDFIKAYTEVYRTPRDFIAAGVFFSTALAVGNRIELKGKYDNVPILWMSLVGDPSTGKTHPLSTALKTFNEADRVSYIQYKEDRRRYEAYNRLSKGDKEKTDTVHPPSYKQHILNDYTPEALFNAHEINPKAICIYRDELKGWIDDFNRYNKSGEQSTMLQTFYRNSLTINRASKEPLKINDPVIYVVGGIQPDLLPDLANDKRAESGFLARFLFVFPDNVKKQKYSKKELDKQYLADLDNFIKYTLDFTGRKKFDAILLPEAENIYSDWFNDNMDKTNKEETGYLKAVYGKFDVYVLRFAIIIKAMNMVCADGIICNVDLKEWEDPIQITAEEMTTAVEIMEYFRVTALKVYHKIFRNKKIKKMDLKDVISYLSERGTSQQKIAEACKVSQPYVSKILKDG